MSTSSLSITLTPRRNLSESYWINLEQVEEKKLATLSEAAEIVDELFLLDPCVATDTPESKEQNEEQQLDREARLAAMAERYYNEIAPELQEKLCSENRYLAEVKLTRSHQDKNYNLLLEGGELLSTRLATETVIRTVRVENSDILDGELPADKDISAVWMGPCWSAAGLLDSNPEITAENGRVYWNAQVSGTVQLVYEQDYALLAIAADRDGCELTALYHLAVDGISITAPEFDDAAEDLCASYDSHTYRHNPEEGDCYIETLHRKVCDCSGNQAGHHRTRQPTACPEDAPVGSIIAWEEEVEYVGCGEVEPVNDPDYYEQKCCEPPEVNLPRCREITRTFTGKGISEEKRAELKRTYGDDVQIILVGPESPPCGTMVYEQDVNARNCCDEVSEILWNYAESAEVVAPSSYVDVFVTGGTSPKKWKVRGQGFWGEKSYTHRDILTQDNRLRIYTDSSACGVCWVSVSDGCSSVTEELRSTQGEMHWYYNNFDVNSGLEDSGAEDSADFDLTTLIGSPAQLPPAEFLGNYDGGGGYTVQVWRGYIAGFTVDQATHMFANGYPGYGDNCADSWDDWYATWGSFEAVVIDWFNNRNMSGKSMYLNPNANAGSLGVPFNDEYKEGEYPPYGYTVWGWGNDTGCADHGRNCYLYAHVHSVWLEGGGGHNLAGKIRIGKWECAS